MAKKTLEVAEKNWEAKVTDAVKRDAYKAGIAEFLGVRPTDIVDETPVKHWETRVEEAVKDKAYEKGIKRRWLGHE